MSFFALGKRFEAQRRVPQVSTLRPGIARLSVLLVALFAPLCLVGPIPLRRQRRLRIRPRIRRHRPALAHRPRPRQSRRFSSRPLPSRPRSARRRYFHRRHAHRPRAHVQLHRAFPRHQARRHRPRLALRNQLPAAYHQLRRRQRRRVNHRTPDGHRRPSPRTGRALSREKSSTATLSGSSFSMAKRPSSSGRPPTPPTAAAILPPNGAATEPSIRSRHLCLPT